MGGSVTFGSGCPENNIDTPKPPANTVQPSEPPPSDSSPLPGSSSIKDNLFQLEINSVQMPNSQNNRIPSTGWSSDDLTRSKQNQPQITPPDLTDSRPRRTTPQQLFDPDTLGPEWPAQEPAFELIRINPSQWQPSLPSSSDRITNVPDGLEPLPGPDSSAEDRENWIYRNQNKLPTVVDPNQWDTPLPIHDYGATP